MSIISSVVNAITSQVTKMVPRLQTGFLNRIRMPTIFKMRKAGHSVSDIVDTISHADPGVIATKLNQTSRTVARLLDTEPHILGWDKTKLLPRNLIVSGRLKGGRNYRTFYQADSFGPKGEFLGRKWYSRYTNTQKAFSEWEQDIVEEMTQGESEGVSTISNISFHHVVHQRGAQFNPVAPK